MLDEDAAQQLEELLAQLDIEWVGAITHGTRPGGVGRAVELRAHDRHRQGQRRRHRGRHAGRQRRRPGRARSCRSPPTARPCSSSPTRTSRSASGSSQRRRPARPAARAGARTSLVDTRLEPDSEDVPKRGTALTTSGDRQQRVPRSTSRSGTVAGDRGGRRRPHPRPGRAAAGRHRAAGVRHRAALGAGRARDPGRPAHRRRPHLVRAGRRARRSSSASRPSFELFGVQGDLMLLVAIAAGLAAGPDRGATIGFAAGLAYDLMLARRPSACRR